MSEPSLRLPDELYVEVTNRCNSKCQTCVRTFETLEPLRDLTLDEFQAIADQLPALRRAVLHGVGEPLLNPELVGMIGYLKQRPNPPHVLFNSNALALTSTWQEALVESELDEFRISIDAAHPELYHQIRGVDAFDQVAANVAAFAQRIARSGGGPRLSLWFTAMQSNLANLADVVRLARRLGVGEVYVQRLVYYGQGLARQEQSLFRAMQSVEQESLKQAEELALSLDIRLSASGSVSPRDCLLSPDGDPRPWSRCRRPWMLMYVTANGHVLPCCFSPFSSRDYPGLILGNVFRQPLAEIWQGAAYRSFRTALGSDAPPESCDRCGVLWSL